MRGANGENHGLYLLHDFELRAGGCLRAPLGRCQKHLLTRTYADFSEELTRKPDNTTTCPFFIDKNDAQQTAH